MKPAQRISGLMEHPFGADYARGTPAPADRALAAFRVRVPHWPDADLATEAAETASVDANHVSGQVAHGAGIKQRAKTTSRLVSSVKENNNFAYIGFTKCGYAREGLGVLPHSRSRAASSRASTASRLPTSRASRAASS